jgi:GNAT superfamily N-acetyltransferase
LSATIRPAVPADASRTADLLTQLGYPSSAAEVEERLARILADEQYGTFVAEIDRTVVGVVGIRVGSYYEKNGLYAHLLVLVVDERQRGSGAGRALVEAAERWALERKARAVLVNSGIQRRDAHRFYERLGYRTTGVRLVKELRASD